MNSRSLRYATSDVNYAAERQGQGGLLVADLDLARRGGDAAGAPGPHATPGGIDATPEQLTAAERWCCQEQQPSFSCPGAIDALCVTGCLIYVGPLI